MHKYLGIGTVFILYVLLFSPVYMDLYITWINNPYASHCFLIPIISLYIVYLKRGKIHAAEKKVEPIGLFFLLPILIVYLVGLTADFAFINRLMMVAALIVLIICMFGMDIFKIVIFPLFLLYFAIPIPFVVINTISFPLQLIATKISSGFIQALSIPVFQEGNMLYFVNVQLEVAKACSGLKALMSMVTLGVLYAYFLERCPLKIITLLSMVPIAILTNVLRISGTGILSFYFGEKIALGYLHTFSGIIFFIIGVLILFGEIAVINKMLKYNEKLWARLIER